MTIQFTPSIAYQVTYQGLFISLGGGNRVAISIYSGSVPSAATVAASWSSYNSSNSNFLIHYSGISTGGIWTVPTSGSGPGTLCQLTTLPTAQTAINSGTASWAIVWCSNVLTVSGTTLPAANFFVVSVSNSTGSGVIRFSSTSITSGTSYTIQDGSFGTTSP